MNNKENIFIRFLRFIGLIEKRPVSKIDMCKQAQNICDRDCESCAWSERKEE